MSKVQTIALSEIAEKLKLVQVNPQVSIAGREIAVPDTSRPSLQLTGYFDHFPYERIQIIGTPEYDYMCRLDAETRRPIYEKLFSYDTPCYVVCRNLALQDDFVEIATGNQIPIFKTERPTPIFTSELIGYLNVVLAPRATIHGVLMDVYGEGVLITGESGVGKSEVALELLRRGHRLVADDAVEIHKVSDEKLVGRAPALTRHFIELRGIGIVDVCAIYGVESVKETQEISFEIHLEEWKNDKRYERIGNNASYSTLLGSKVMCYTVPIRPGRNIAVIVETAAVNYRQKMMGYDPLVELRRRLEEQYGTTPEELL